MIPTFINRLGELNFLENLYSKKGFKLVVLYGRRRTGKTELIKYFLKDKAGVYILATDENIIENIKEFKTKFYELTKRDYFLNLNTDSFYDLFKFLKEEIKDNIIIAIDEFPYLLNLNRGLLSTFQKIIDELLNDSQIMLILCGSSLSIMENDVLGYRSPLYGRKVNSWKLLPFTFYTVYGHVKDIRKALEIYFVFGSIPYYINFYNTNQDLLINIRENILTKGTNLYDEPLILLRQEFRESRTYRLILKYISLGYKNIGKLCSVTGMDKSNIMKYLSTLEETNIVKHILPLGMKRKGFYEITDPFFRFWFKFIYPNRDQLEIGNILIVEGNIKDELNSFFGLSFEYFIEELIVLKCFYELEKFIEIKKWWDKDKEIDIVALNEDKKEILFAECKWQDKVNALKIVSEINEKSEYVKWNNKDREESYAIFAKSFTKKIDKFNDKKVYCYDLRDIEKSIKKAK